jgi:hypothetical protein
VDDRRVLADYLAANGADAAELEEAAASATLGALGLDLALRDRAGSLSFAVACENAGLALHDGAAIWRALGFPDPRATAPVLSGGEVRALQLLGGMAQTSLGGETTRQLARVIGNSMAQLAEALVDSFRVQFELPSLGAGTP